VRLDVDTTADLDAAVALGVGRHTAAALSLSARG
jgi:2-phospho-L-lactate guanylyltransferase (CobY/MobA/RfbA family)